MCLPTKSKAGIRRLPQKLGGVTRYGTWTGGPFVVTEPGEVEEEDEALIAEKTEPPSELEEPDAVVN